ncbi:MAG TPA: HAD family hydrolase [bacterium]|nr:HAD family hydrolase [bacterium]
MTKGQSNGLRLILFDFGGVIASEGFQFGILKLALEFGRSYSEMTEIVSRKASYESGYSAGKCGEKEFWKIIAKELNIRRDLSRFRHFILDNFVPRKEVIAAVKRLRGKYRLGIFSDQTNWIHELDGIYGFFRYFDHLFISCDRGMTKHDGRFYELPPGETGYKTSEILLIDDKSRVLETARRKGYKTYLFESVENFVHLSNNLLKK